jgi:ABC-type branched-subunit amino acid transport system substrate-binding protein
MRNGSPVRRSRTRILTVACVFGTALAISACSTSGSSDGDGAPSSATAAGIPAGNITLGAILSLSGPYAEYGKSIQGELQVAVNQVNASGGVLGHKFTLDIQNDQGNPSTSVQLAEKFVSQEVTGITYAGFPNVYSQTVPIFMKAHIPVFQIDPTGTILGNGGVAKFPYYFNNYAAPSANISALVEAIPKGTKVAVIGDGSPNAVGLTQAFDQLAPGHGITIAATETYSQTALDVTSQLRAAENSGATTLVILTGTGYAQVYNGLRAIAWTPEIVTTSGAVVDGAASMGNLVSHIVYSCAPVSLPAGGTLGATLNTYLNGVDKLVGGPEATHQTAPSIGDSVFAFATAIEATHSTSGPKLKADFETWKNQALMTNYMTYTFTPQDHNGVANSEVHICDMDKTGPQGLPVRVAVTP